MEDIMSIEEAQELLGRLTYKPRSWFEIDLEQEDKVILRIHTEAPDAYKPGDTVVVGTGLVLPLTNKGIALSRDNFMSQVQKLILLVEEHERREWLKIDGEPLYDPHTQEVAAW